MGITTFSSRELNQDIGRAKKAARGGPVIITDRGQPAYALLTIEAYRLLTGQKRSLIEALSMSGLADIDFEPPRASITAQAADFS
ncbi:MAG: type II toxin-antitoxin system prevent-host-death family antitoxin [Microgenomates group bacterium]|jgi:prevent-host-death family protein